MLQLKSETNDTSEISSFQTFLLQAQTLLKHVANEQAQSREIELRMAFLKKQKMDPLGIFYCGTMAHQWLLLSDLSSMEEYESLSL